MNTSIKHYLTGALLSALLFFAGSTGAASNIIYVNLAARGNGDGSSWQKAYRDLQDALAVAPGNCEIWVARGTYYPTTDSERSATFQLKKGVSLYGGFAGREKSRALRNWQANKTVLSGDLGRKKNRSDNSYHVVTGATGAILDGFTITGGYAIPDRKNSNMQRPPRNRGSGSRDHNRGGRRPGGPGGMRGSHTSPEAILQGSPGSGGGLNNFKAATVVRNCRFTENSALKGVQSII